MDDLGKITRSGNRVRALCVAAWVEDWIRPWVAATQAEALGDAKAWAEVPAPDLDPVVEEALKGLTLTVNDINGGKRPRARSILLHDYIDYLKRKATGQPDDN